MTRRRAILSAALLCALSCVATARVFFALDEGLEYAVPGAVFEREVLYPSEGDLQRASDLAGLEIPEAPVYRYLATVDGKLVAYAYPDRHRVRTLPETVLVIVRPDGSLSKIVVLAFAEPQEYMANGRWYEQFTGRLLDEELRLNRGIDGITGATLTARATVQCARRVLALHEVLPSGATRD